MIFDANKKAVGVEYEPSESYQPELSLSKKPATVARARKMVIVSAGALGTPQILERSGIGAAEVLEKLDIPVISDLPGVGENYQDHHLLLYPYKTSLGPDESLDGLLSGRLDFAKACEERNPILSWNAIDISAKLRPSSADVATFRPGLKSAWESDFKDKADRPLMLMGVINRSADAFWAHRFSR